MHWTYWELEGDRVHTHCTEGGRWGGQRGPTANSRGSSGRECKARSHIFQIYLVLREKLFDFSQKKKKTAVMKTKDWDQNQLIVSGRDTTVHVIC